MPHASPSFKSVALKALLFLGGLPLASGCNSPFSLRGPLFATTEGGGNGSGEGPKGQNLPPSQLTFGASSLTATAGNAIVPDVPSYQGTVTNFAVSPSLPAGLRLDLATGVLSGTPTQVSPLENYTVTASNSTGSTTTIISIEVNDVPPDQLGYAVNPVVCFAGVAIAPNAPSSSGGAATSYSVSPALPAGLTLNLGTGVLTGAALAPMPQTTYTVTASNSGGSTSIGLLITVNPTPPDSFTYSQNPVVATKGIALANDVPSNTGTGLSYSISPNLPAGLTMNLSTGAISGTATTTSTQANYTVTASNGSSSTTAVLSLTVNDIAPSNLTYSQSTAVYTKGQAISPNIPHNGGGTATSYSISPSLPTGLQLSPTTGVISGSPGEVVSQKTYAITASNSGGSTTVSLSITVNDATPSTLTYSSNPATYTKGQTIPANTPSNKGGTVTAYSISPSLPAGLAFNTTTGVLSGTPSLLSPVAFYTVTATNSGGSTSTSLSLAVNDIPPSQFAYKLNPWILTVGTLFSNEPSSQGGAVVSYSIQPSTLPSGISFSSSSGELSGTPTTLMAATVYTITATNSGGSAVAAVTITVTASPPPNDVTDFSATPASSSSVTLTWKAASVPSGGKPIAGYLLAQAQGSTPPSSCDPQATPILGTSYTVTGLSPEQTYSFLLCTKDTSQPALLSSGVPASATTLNAPPTVWTLNSVSPNWGTSSGGTVITLSGQDFPTGTSSSVLIGKINCLITGITSTTITCTTGAGAAGFADITVALGTQIVTLPRAFLYESGAGTACADGITPPRYFGLPGFNGFSVGDINNIFGIRSDTGRLYQWQYNDASWRGWDLAVTKNSSNSGPALSQIAATDTSNIFGVRSDNGHVNQWQWTNANGWANGDLTVTKNPSNSGPSLSQIAAADTSNIFGVRSDNGHVNQWLWTSANGWRNGDLTVTKNSSNYGPSLKAIGVIEATDLQEVFGIRSDNGHVNVWQWTGANGWTNGDLTVTKNPSNSGPSVSQITAGDINNIFGVRSDNGHVNQWQYTSANGWTNGDIYVSGSPSNFGPAVKAIHAVDASHIFGLRFDTGQLMEWYYDPNQGWSDIEFCGAGMQDLVPLNVSTIFGTDAADDTSLKGELLQWSYPPPAAFTYPYHWSCTTGIPCSITPDYYYNHYTDLIPSGTFYSISPGLPPGLSFDSSSGKISGTPTAASPVTLYTITARNAAGSQSTYFSFPVYQCGILSPGQTLLFGQSLLSCNGKHQLSLYTNNLYQFEGTSAWPSFPMLASLLGGNIAPNSSPAIDGIGNLAYRVVDNTINMNGFARPSVEMMPNTNAAVSNGVFAWQSNAGQLWAAQIFVPTDLQYPVMPGTSPAITSFYVDQEVNGISVPSFISVIAWQAPNGHLNLHSSASGFQDLAFNMMPGTSPSINSWSDGTNGTWRIAWQAANGHLNLYDSANGFQDLGFTVMPGTNPSIGAFSDERIAWQSSNGHLNTYSSTTGFQDLGLTPMPGTNPSVADLWNGGFEIAFQNWNGQPCSVSNFFGVYCNGLAAMSSGTSPSVGVVASDDIFGFRIAYNASGFAVNDPYEALSYLVLDGNGSTSYQGNLAVMQTDGNFAFSINGYIKWSTGTSGHPNASLVLQDDGQLAIYDKGTLLWTGKPGN